MKPEDYIELVKGTESNDFIAISQRLNDIRTIRLLHAGLGLATEAAEFLDALKKFIFYGKDLDVINLGEELGDLNWYQAIAVDEIGTSYEQIWQINISKLRARYGKKFNESRTLNRDLNKERKILEGDEK